MDCSATEQQENKYEIIKKPPVQMEVFSH